MNGPDREPWPPPPVRKLQSQEFVLGWIEALSSWELNPSSFIPHPESHFPFRLGNILLSYPPHPSNPTVLPLRNFSILWVSSRSCMLSASPVVPERPASSEKSNSSASASDSPVYIQYFLFGLKESHNSLGIPGFQCYGVTLSSAYRKDTEIQRRQAISSMS